MEGGRVSWETWHVISESMNPVKKFSNFVLEIINPCFFLFRNLFFVLEISSASLSREKTKRIVMRYQENPLCFMFKDKTNIQWNDWKYLFIKVPSPNRNLCEPIRRKEIPRFLLFVKEKCFFMEKLFFSWEFKTTWIKLTWRASSIFFCRLEIRLEKVRSKNSNNSLLLFSCC